MSSRIGKCIFENKPLQIPAERSWALPYRKSAFENATLVDGGEDINLSFFALSPFPHRTFSPSYNFQLDRLDQVVYNSSLHLLILLHQPSQTPAALFAPDASFQEHSLPQT